jgi:LDH2 family malate/lactate/ureidoglycolate dehydrogenase
MTEKDACFRFTDLQDWTSSVFQKLEVEKKSADEAARLLIRTNLRGVDTHGISRVTGYVEKLRTGELKARPQIEMSFRDGMLFLDGDGGLGQVVGMQAVTEAVSRAANTGVVTCFIRRSGHLAAIGQFVLEAAERGMVAMICQETPPLMAPKGSSRPVIGNNPIAFACPVKGKPPLVFDMATSVVARGNLIQAVSDGKKTIPDGWAIGPDGEVTLDPQRALQGAMLPVAGHKGIGLAMMVQVLAGSLTGSMTADSAASHGATSSAGNVSGFLMVINPARVVGQDAFDNHVEGWISTYLSGSGPNSRYPGQRADEYETKRKVAGIPIPLSTQGELEKVGKSVGVAFDLPTI